MKTKNVGMMAMYKFALIAIFAMGIPTLALAQQVPNPGEAMEQPSAGMPADEEGTSDAQAVDPDAPQAGEQMMEEGVQDEGMRRESAEGESADGTPAAGEPEATGREDKISDSSERALTDEDVMDMSCDDLWIARNEIFDRNGYCFRTKRGQDYFDNSDCTSDSQDILSQLEWENVKLIKRHEARKGCR